MFGIAAPAAAEIGLLKGGGGLIKGGISKVLSIFPKKGAMQTAIKTVGELKTERIIEAGTNYVKHNPLAKELWGIIKPTIEKKTQASDVVAKMFDVWKGAYSKTGDVRTTAEAQLYSKLYGAARQTIKDQAPEISKHLDKLRFLHEIPEKVKIAQKGTWMALKATAIGKMLGL